MVKKIYKSFVLLLVVTAMLFVAHPRSSAYTSQVEIMRIGLYYGSTELSSANLA